ncbi:NAD(P)-dependent oxidoreductase [Pasteurella multocida]|uniref:NAD(P)-dependent oxidoreductase n=1 Tax=Pasteurella multocida TaxID=747 RepID=UPI0020236278|nr:NAD(P)H-binding protein [Pasteurella multocida]URI05415.1 NAD(P)H-binding protein [Pasteurella multocida]HDR1186948.1 NAD(P)H-binding protein [Pasteurella multocida]HDR1315592.1 NAD(P)H-binding protein [Pasteurella multocida]
MKVAVVAANGRVSQKVIKEALGRGMEVSAFGRGAENKTLSSNYIQKDIMELTKEDLIGFDAVVDGFGAWKEEEFPMHIKTSQHLADLLSGTDIQLVIVGGAGSLYLDKEHTMQVKDGSDFPKMFLPLANAQGEELAKLRERNDVNWTFISPAADFRADGERTGKYIIAGEELTLNSKGESVISYADYAVALVDILESGKYKKARISVLGE